MTWSASAQQVFAVLGPWFLVAAAWRFVGPRRSGPQARTWFILGAIFSGTAIDLARSQVGAG